MYSAQPTGADSATINPAALNSGEFDFLSSQIPSMPKPCAVSLSRCLSAPISMRQQRMVATFHRARFSKLVAHATPWLTRAFAWPAHHAHPISSYIISATFKMLIIRLR